MQAIVGERGWVSKLDPLVASRLQSWKNGFDSSSLLELVRAIRNVFEHWFERQGYDEVAEAQRLRAVGALTGWSDEREMKQGHASSEGQKLRAAAVAHYFVRQRFRSCCSCSSSRRRLTRCDFHATQLLHYEHDYKLLTHARILTT